MGLTRTVVLAAVLAAALSACAGDDDAPALTVYLKARLGPEGPPGQIAPVLTPVERVRRSGTSPARQAVLELRTGPSPDERARGFLDTLSPQTRLIGVRLADGVATVRLAGKEPDFYGAGAIVYTVTELGGVEAVRLLLDGRPCCAFLHSGEAVARLTRRTYRHWQGEPCSARITATHVRCRG